MWKSRRHLFHHSSHWAGASSLAARGSGQLPLSRVCLQGLRSCPSHGKQYSSQESKMGLGILHKLLHLRKTLVMGFPGGRSKAFSSAAFYGKLDNSMSKWFILIKHLMHVYTHHDQITLCNVHVNSEVEISYHWRFWSDWRNFAHVNITIDRGNSTGESRVYATPILKLKSWRGQVLILHRPIKPTMCSDVVTLHSSLC